MDRISRYFPSIAWIYRWQPPKDWRRSWPHNDGVSAFSSVVKASFRELFERQINIPCTVWAQADPFTREYVLAVSEDHRGTEIFQILKSHFGASKFSDPGRTLKLLQAPQRVPAITNRQLTPIFRFQDGAIIAYQDAHQTVSECPDSVSGLPVLCRHWFRAEAGETESYESVPPGRQTERRNSPVSARASTGF